MDDPCMADPGVDHSFVYTEGGYTDIAALPFFDVNLGVDTTVNGYIERIRYTLVKSLEVHLGVFRRLEPDYDELPLHLSYVALQTLYRENHTSDPSPAADSSDIHIAVVAEVSSVNSPGSLSSNKYWRPVCLIVA